MLMNFDDKVIFMDACGIHSPAKCVADLSSPLLAMGTYPIVRKGPRPEIWTLSTLITIGRRDMVYSGHKVGHRLLLMVYGI